MHSRCSSPSDHDHSFGQDVRRPQERRVKIVVAVTIVVMIAEIAAGLLTGSMALLADGIHMGTHALALGLAAIAYVFTRRYAWDRRFSLGTGKASELAAFASAVLLGVTAVLVAGEALLRVLAPEPIAYAQALAVAVIGLVVNLLSMLLLAGRGSDPHRHSADDHHGHGHAHPHHHHHGDNNLRGAILHVAADALTSVAAIAALGLAWWGGWNWLDPVVALGATAVIVAWAIGLARDAARVLLDVEATDDRREAVRKALEADGDSKVVDLHLWSVGPGSFTLVASVVTHLDIEPDEYKARLPAGLAIHHPVVEVQRCRVVAAG
ncbi:MAG: cation efflux system protein [Alphaproteobacteria bacterium]|nr:MAG: cation efflux system protein [Alphaproteobacteria bacterium]